MPLVIHPRVRKVVMRLAATTSVAMFATTGAALASSCPIPSTTQAFASLGDTSSYFPVPDGTLSDPTLPGWTLNNASVTSGGNPFQIGGSQSANSVTINSSGWVQTAPFCVDSTMPTFRFAAQQVSGGSPLQVQIVGTSSDVLGVTLNLASLADGSASSWTVLNPTSLTAGYTIASGISYMGALRFRVPYGGGSWKIDDVFVDPYRMG